MRNSSALTVVVFGLLLTAAQAGQHEISGTVRDFDGKPISGAKVELKTPSFDTAFFALSDASGHYSFKADDGLYLAATAVREQDYRKTALEFWAWNVPVDSDLTLDIRYQRLEIYGVNVFNVQGGPPGLFAYFRPMSLQRAGSKDLSKDADIAPPVEQMDVAIDVNGIPAKIDTIERVEEFTGGPKMYGYLVHFTSPPSGRSTDVIRIVGKDKGNGDMGEALYFRVKPAYK